MGCTSSVEEGGGGGGGGHRKSSKAPVKNKAVGEAKGQEKNDEKRVDDMASCLETVKFEPDDPLNVLAKLVPFNLATLKKLQKIFDAISDINEKDSYIDKVELSKALELPLNSSLANNIFKVFDTTECSKINFRAWVRTLAILAPDASLEKKIKFAFDLYVNKEGTITYDEMTSLLNESISNPISPDALRKDDIEMLCKASIEGIDKDGNNKIDFDEYRDMIMKNELAFREYFSLDIDDLCSKLFSVLDVKKTESKDGEKKTNDVKKNEEANDKKSEKEKEAEDTDAGDNDCANAKEIDPETLEGLFEEEVVLVANKSGAS